MAKKKKIQLEFDEEKHCYTYQNEIVPSVTTILKEVGLSDYSNIPTYILEQAAERGTNVHKIIEWYELGVLDEDSIDPALRGYFESYLRAKDAKLLFTGNKPEITEKKVFHEEYKYAGTLDQLYDNEWLNDLKTTKPRVEHGLQLSAYWLAEVQHELIYPRKLTCTYLHKDGKIADVVEYEHDPGAWLNTLTFYRWKEKHGLIKKQ